jgi:hypothetical protein
MSGLAFNLHVENNCLAPSFRKEEVWPINLTPSHFIEMSVPSKESERLVYMCSDNLVIVCF